MKLFRIKIKLETRQVLIFTDDELNIDRLIVELCDYDVKLILSNVISTLIKCEIIIEFTTVIY